MARTSAAVRPPVPPAAIPTAPPTPFKSQGFLDFMGMIAASELDNNAAEAEVIICPSKYVDDRNDLGPHAEWWYDTETSRCWATVLIYQQIEPHPRLVQYVRFDEWTGFPIVRKPTGVPLTTLLEQHRSSMYKASDGRTALFRLEPQYLPMVYQWTLQLVNAIRYIHAQRLGPAPAMPVVFADPQLHWCWLSSDMSLSVLGFRDSGFQTPDGGYRVALGRTRGVTFHPLEGKSCSDYEPTQETDIFLTACVIYELMTGFWPGEGQDLDTDEVRSLLTRQEWPRLEAQYLGDVVRKCWSSEITTGDQLMSTLHAARLGWEIRGEDELVGFDAAALFA